MKRTLQLTGTLIAAITITLSTSLLPAAEGGAAGAGDQPPLATAPREEPRAEAAAPAVGRPAPTFTLQNLEGTSTVKLADFKGKVVLLDFWATWCPPCRASIPALDGLYKKHKDKGFVVLGLNNEDDHAKVKAFAKSRISYPVLVDATAQFKKYEIEGIPTFFLIDKQGVIRHKQVGYSPGLEKEIEKKIAELLNKK